MPHAAIKRRDDWPQILAAELERLQDAPFSWGTHDCGLFAGNMVLALTGTDVVADLRGRWDDAMGAMREVEQCGGIESMAAARLGPPRDGPLYAQRGDVVLADLEHGATLGVCEGAHAVFVGEHGLVRVPIALVRVAWAV